MRLAPKSVDQELFKAVLALETKVRASGLDDRLYLLVKARASQINSCAHCIDMHMKELRARGESEEKLFLLSAWREAERFFTPKERAALAWTETVTLIADTHVPDHEWEAVRKEFSEEEVAKLTFAIGTINIWNRISVSFRTPPGTRPADA
ncbi:MAG: carboxymuconolactone decarboxylase family protein [Parvibaculaceae bacterium]|jgi:AhpD family alkylhydroperoxidase